MAGGTRRWIALGVLLVGTLMDLLDATVLNIALPAVQRDVGADDSALQWVMSSYPLAFAVALVIGGRLGDRYGRRRMFLTAMAAFVLASVLAGLAGGPGPLVAARVAQGLAAAVMVPQVLAIMRVSFPPQDSGRVFGLFGAVCSIGAVSGPVVGALLLQLDPFGLGWRSIFLVNVPVGLVGLVLGRRFLAESRAPRAPGLDVVGAGLAAVGLLLVLMPLIEDWPAVSAAAGVLVLALFAVHERRVARCGRTPLVEPALLGIRSFAAGLAVQLAFSAVFALYSLASSLFLQLGLGWDALGAALASMLFGVPMGVASVLAARVLLPRLGRGVLQLGLVLVAGGMVACAAVVAGNGTATAAAALAVPFAVAGAGAGMVTAPLTAVVLREVPPARAGSASGLLNTVRQVGWAIGFGLASLTYLALGDDAPVGAAAVAGLIITLGWVAAGAVGVFLLTWALPRHRPAPRAPAVSRAEEGVAP